MDVYQWTLAARQDLDTYLAIAGSSLPYNLAHAVGNVVFCLVIGPVFIRSLRRYRRRFEVRWAPRALGPAGLAVTVVAVALMLAPAAVAATPGARAATYLKRVQNRDGGFGAAKAQGSNQLITGWVALGLESARINPRQVKRSRGRAVTTYLRRGAGSLKDTGELERTIMVLASAKLNPRRFAGRDLVAELMRRRRGDGSWAGNVAHTAFGIFALRAAGAAAGSASVQESARWLVAQQNADGGFGYVAKAETDTDDTGAVLQALGAAGVGRRRRRERRRRLPAQDPEQRRRLGSDAGPELEHAVDRLGRPGARRRRDQPGRSWERTPCASSCGCRAATGTSVTRVRATRRRPGSPRRP